MSIVSKELMQDLLAFRSDRDWEKFHTPKNISIAVAVEASELLEIFQWAGEERVKELIVTEHSAIADEVADIAILLAYLCHDLSIDLDSAVRAKFTKNGQKYPVELARGVSTKYDRLK